MNKTHRPAAMSSDWSVVDEAIRPSMYLLISGRVETWEVARCTAIRKMFLKKYWNLCKSGILHPIESIPHADKRHYWDESAKAGDDRELRHECCLLAYVVDYLCGADPDGWATDPLGAAQAPAGGA